MHIYVAILACVAVPWAAGIDLNFTVPGTDIIVGGRVDWKLGKAEYPNRIYEKAIDVDIGNQGSNDSKSSTEEEVADKKPEHDDCRLRVPGYETPSDYVCPSESDSCYKVYVSGASWNEAREKCRKDGGYLCVLNDEAEATIVTKLCKDANTKQSEFRIGMHNYFGKYDWCSVLGNPKTKMWMGWAKGEPNFYNSAHHCVVLKKWGGLNDTACGAKMPFVCEQKNVNGTKSE